ncbi:hypothetical protein [Methylobrevis albus]|uniref:MarR family transcriptional regulator n=1 Tax=Methylobrevis albus TaxID=2793297 RepID=A0A931MZZ4_9HYPH|nr:hypothetical protein [Methylobrevis albus]MBH0238629.1 hypothetical protein [Methylobrevis albus]
MSHNADHDAAAESGLSRRTLLAGLGAAALAAPAVAATAAPAAGAMASGGPDVPPAAPVAPVAPVADEAVTADYFEALRALQRAHNRLLDTVCDELQRAGCDDLSGAEGLLLLNIAEVNGDRRLLRTYAGTWNNCRAMMSRLAKRGYVTWTDRDRSTRIELTARGQEAVATVLAGLTRQTRSVHYLSGVSHGELGDARQTLARLDRFWTDTILYRL